MIFSKNMLDNWETPCYIIQARVGEICGFFTARNAMMREIASKGGNFRGVCPVIGRLNCLSALAYIAARWGRVGLGRPFFMARSDTHGGADRKQFDRTQTLRKLST